MPSQIEPRHSLVTGTGELVEPISLPPLAALLVPQGEGLGTAAVYEEFDRLGLGRRDLEPDGLRRLAEGGDPAALLAAAENDLQQATLSLRPELEGVLAELADDGAGAALVAGSGPTCAGLFADLGTAQLACSRVERCVVAVTRA